MAGKLLKDGTPTLEAGLRAVLSEQDAGEQPVDVFEIRFLASKEITYRYWLRGAEEPEGGVIQVG